MVAHASRLLLWCPVVWSVAAGARPPILGWSGIVWYLVFGIVVYNCTHEISEMNGAIEGDLLHGALPRGAAYFQRASIAI